MKQYLADMWVYDVEGDGSVAPYGRIDLKMGALRVTLILNERERRELAAALIRPYGSPKEVFADVTITPLRLPANIRELNNETLNVRTVEVPHEPLS